MWFNAGTSIHPSRPRIDDWGMASCKRMRYVLWRTGLKWGQEGSADSYCIDMLLLLAGLNLRRRCVPNPQEKRRWRTTIFVLYDGKERNPGSAGGGNLAKLSPHEKTRRRVSNSKCFSKRFTPNRHNWNLIFKIDKISDCIRIDFIVRGGVKIPSERGGGFAANLIRVFDLRHFFLFHSIV